MLTKIRKFEAAGAQGEFEAVDHRPEECAFCEAARQRGIRFHEDHDNAGKDEAIIFLENEAGTVHRIAAIRCDGVVVIEGQDVTPEAARAEIAAKEKRHAIN